MPRLASMASLRLLVLLLIVSTAWADQQVHHGEASRFIRTVTSGLNKIITEDQYQEIEEAFKNVTEDVDTLVPIPVLKEIADVLVLGAESQISDEVPEQFKKIQQLIDDGFANIKRSLFDQRVQVSKPTISPTRSLNNSVNDLKCSRTSIDYKTLHGQSAHNVRFLLKTLYNDRPEPTERLAVFKQNCVLMGFNTALQSLAGTLLTSAPSYATHCLAIKQHSYTAVLDIKRRIKADAFGLSLNAVTCDRALYTNYDLDLESSLEDVQRFLFEMNDAQETNALEGLKGTLTTYIHDRKFDNTLELATSLLETVEEYNSTSTGYVADIRPKESEMDEATVLAPGCEKQLLELKELNQPSVSVYAVNLTANGTRAHRQWLTEHRDTLKRTLTRDVHRPCGYWILSCVHQPKCQ
uniref:Secreted protein n=1 Tax=Steinernema glaseri TaxID=37863 RepID=A0A1I7YTE6_9BILA